MKIFAQEEVLHRYLEAHSNSEDPVLAELSRHTHLNEVHPRMLSGHLLGSFLSVFSSLLSPARILEIGTYTGYSAICLAKGLRKGGELLTLEVNDELRPTAQRFFNKAGLRDQIELINGDALELIPRLKGEFDLVFMDAHKEDYGAYFDLVLPKLRTGGYILADNVLWGGKVLDPKEKDPITRAIQEFNKKVAEDQRVDNLMLPLRDGIMLIKKL